MRDYSNNLFVVGYKYSLTHSGQTGPHFGRRFMNTTPMATHSILHHLMSIMQNMQTYITQNMQNYRKVNPKNDDLGIFSP